MACNYMTGVRVFHVACNTARPASKYLRLILEVLEGLDVT
jgi:hypothetical protein